MNLNKKTMSLKISDVKKYSIQFAEMNEVFVQIGPCTFKKQNFTQIPMDGRIYECAGKIYLANGLDLQASFRIKKSEDPLLIDDSIYTKVDEIWYKLSEREFYIKTELNKEDIFPIEWEPDIPLEDLGKGPFKMEFKI